VREVRGTDSDVCLTRYSDAQVVRVGDQEPPLQLINANAAGPLRHSDENTVFCMQVFIPNICVLMCS